MNKSLLITYVLMAFSNITFAGIKYDPSAKTCPKADENNRYISVPVFHDLEKIAKVENIPGLNIHEVLSSEYEGMEISVFYEVVNKFDSKKETVFMIPGGPGQSHTFIHGFERQFQGKSEFFQKYNVIVMDHRGLGCSRPTFPGNEPHESLLMRYAAADIEMIKRNISPKKKIHIWGFSYGSMLAQTYALLFPQSIDKLFLGGAFSSASDFSQAQRDYVDLVVESSIGRDNYNNFISLYPEYKDRFLDYTVNEMYDYTGRVVRIPETLESLIVYIQTGQTDQIGNLLAENESYILPWMMRSISCTEIFDYNSLPNNEYTLFGGLFRACKEFKGITEYFNYTDLLVNLPMDTFIFGGKYDHVTPAKAMKKMSQKIPNNFLYIDEHIGHGLSPKIDCFISFMDSFFDEGLESDLEGIKHSDACTKTPELD